jgi:putative FmdB family regulatory protein
MPTYEYRCGHCGRFQMAQRITEPPLTVCPACGEPVQRLISNNVGIIFKGPGFYCTDNRSNSGQNMSGGRSHKAAAAAGSSDAEARTEQGSDSTAACLSGAHLADGGGAQRAAKK